MKKKTIVVMLIGIISLLEIGCASKFQDKATIGLETTTIEANPLVSTDLMNENEKNEWVISLDKIEERMKEVPYIYMNITPEELSCKFETLKDNIIANRLDKQQAYMELKKIIASCKHLHLTVEYIDSEEYLKFHLYPLRYIWMKEGMVIGAVNQEQADLLGSRIISICGLSIDEYIDKIRLIKPSETDAGILAYLSDVSTEELAYLGIIDNPTDKLVMEVEKHGKKEIVSFDSYLYQDMMQMEPVSIFNSEDSEKFPFRYQLKKEMSNNGEKVGYRLDYENKIMVLEYTNCFVDKDIFNNVFDNMINELVTQNIDTLVIDIEDNGGGNRFTLWNKMDEYRDLLKEKKVKLIIGYRTASAAVFAIEDTLNIVDDVKLFGYPSAGAIKNATEKVYVDYPEIGIRLGVPTIEDNLTKLISKYGFVKDSVKPDVPVQVSFDELINGYDAVYEEIINDK